MFAKRTKTPVDFHDKKCFEFLQKIAGAIAADDVLDSGMLSAYRVVGSEEQLQFLKDFRNQYTNARFDPGIKYQEILRHFLFQLEVQLRKSSEFMSNPAVKELINMLFDEHCSAAKNALETRELMPGTLTVGHGKVERISPLFLAWIAYNAPRTPEPVKQRSIHLGKQQPKVFLLYLNILPVQQDHDVPFSQFMDEVREEYNFSQVIGLNLPHDLTLKNNRTFKAAGMFKREDLIELMTDLVCDHDRAFFIQGGEAMLMTREKVRIMIENSMRTLGVETMESMGREEALAVYFHLIKYEMVQSLIDKYHPQYLNFTTHDKHDRVNITSAYHALVQSIESGEPLTRARFNAVLFAPEHETVRVRQDQLAILWKAMHTYMRALRVRGKEVPEWLPDWLNKHMPQHSKDWYIKKLNELIGAQVAEYNQANEIKKTMPAQIRDVSMFEKGLVLSAKENLCAVKIKSILQEPDRCKGILTKEDLQVINAQPALKEICDSLKKFGLADIEKYLETPSSRYSR